MLHHLVDIRVLGLVREPVEGGVHVVEHPDDARGAGDVSVPRAVLREPNDAWEVGRAFGDEITFLIIDITSEIFQY